MAVTQTFEISGTAAVTKEGNATGADEKPKIKPGMTSEVKNLYEGRPDDRGKSTWVDKYPDDLEEAAENAESARFALIIRNKKCYDGRKKLQVHSVVVQSPLLKKAFETVFDGYAGITVSLDRLTFKAPFKPFVHRWTRIEKALEEESDPETRSHLDLFHRIMGEELQNDLKARADYIANKVITWDTAWMIFEPGTTIFAMQENQKSAFRLTQGSYMEARYGPAFGIDCEKVDWDGEKFGLQSTRLFVYKFLGTKQITTLAAFPLEYHEDVAEVKKELIERGKAFERFAGYHYKHYKGFAIGYTMCGPVKYNVSHPSSHVQYSTNRN